ncbi:MAG: serine/threonine protein kinase [Myxococcales bacterium]|nr:serine/threonine protein kinase [Myxococcales bacterium]
MQLGGIALQATDPDDTIDAAEPGTPEVPAVHALPATEAAGVRPDYPSLIQVDRERYAVARVIAKGGMGRVTEARDLRLGRQVAIKELLPENRDFARRFEREARITARLQHPSIIHVYEAGVWPGGEPFYAMPMVSGQSLDKAVAERPSLAQRLSLIPTVIAVADALAYAHNANIIHRDLKPANVLVGKFGETVVIDWGLAKDLGAQSDPKESLQLRAREATEDTASGSIVGTPAYMPPEQARGELQLVDRRADVYALGALLYKVLVGRAAYEGASAQDILEQVKAGPPIPVPVREPGAPPDLVAIVAKAMARDPADRYTDADELAQDLKRFETGRLVAAHHYTWRQLLARWLRRHRWAVGIGAVAVVVLAIVATISVLNILDTRARADARRRALQEETGRGEILAGRLGKALAYLLAAAEDGSPGGTHGLLVAEAMQAFETEVAHLAGTRAGEVLVAVSADGARVATATAGTVTLWESTKPIQTFAAPFEIDALALDATGSRVVAGGGDGIARVWAANAPAIARELRAGDAPLRAVEVSPDGRQLVTAGDDGDIKLWELTTGASVTADCHPASVVSAHFAPAGVNRIVAASADGSACVIDTTKTTSGATPLHGHKDGLTSAIWSRDGAWVITTSMDGTARVTSSGSGKLVVVPLRHELGSAIRAVAISHDGERLITGGDDAVGRIWELPAVTPQEAEQAAAAGNPPTARLIATLDRHAGPILAVAFSRDDRWVATGAKDGLAKISDARTGELVASFEHGGAVDALAFTASSDLVTGSSDGSARISRLVEPPRWDLGSPIHTLAVAIDGTVAAGKENSVITLLRPPYDRAPEFLDGHLGRVLAIAFTGDGQHLVSAGDDPQPIVWNLATGTHSFLHEQPAPIRALAVSRDGSLAATVTGDQRVRLWSIATGDAVRELIAPASVTAVAFSPDGSSIVAGLQTGALARWRTRDGVSLGVQPVISGEVTALAFAPSRAVIAIGGHTDARVFSLDEGGGLAAARPLTVDGPTGEVRGLAFACGGHCVITAGADGITRIWDADKGKLLGTRGFHGPPITGLAMAGDTLWLAGEGTEGRIGAYVVRSDTRSLDELRAFFRDFHLPWELDDDDVPIRREATGAR